MVDLDLNPARRSAVVERLGQALFATAPTAKVAVRGSLANGTADHLSDIDLLMTVHGNDFERCLLEVPAAVARVEPVRLFRIDPETLRSPARRLIYVLFRELPLFWRLDLEVTADPPPRAATDSDVPWSLPASALMNAVAAIKALARGDEATAAGLLERGFSRLDLPLGEGPLAKLVLDLAAACAEREPPIGDIAAEVAAVCASLLAA